MKKLSGAEKGILALTAVFLLGCAAVFSLRGSDGPGVTVSRQPQAVELQSAQVQEDGTPDSLLPGEKIDVNTAPPLDLARLPGIGATRAEAMASWRAENGPFRTEEDLLAVKGIGEGILERIRPYITFG